MNMKLAPAFSAATAITMGAGNFTSTVRIEHARKAIARIFGSFPAIWESATSGQARNSNNARYAAASNTLVASLRIRLTIRLSDAGLRQRQTELLNPNHRPSPWPTEDAGSRARSSRLLGANTASYRRAARFVHVRAYSAHA